MTAPNDPPQGPPRHGFYARRLVEHTALPGRLRLALLGSERTLLESGRIAAVRTVRADDGTELCVWVVKAPARSGQREAQVRGTVLLLHGLWDSKARMFRLAQVLSGKGFDAVLPDLRAHGQSAGRYTTFGALEKHDLAKVMTSLAKEGLVGGQTYVAGFSMGGGIAVQYASLANSPACRTVGHPPCGGVLALAPVASARLIMQRMLAFAAPFMRQAQARQTIDRAGKLAGFNVDSASAIEDARDLRCPIIVVHGTLDRTVPPSHGRAIFEAACEPKELCLFARGHNSLLLGRTAWIARQIQRLAQAGQP